MAFDPTAEQSSAINEKGNILVAAAAGSGKTAVLVERVIKKLTDEVNPVSADRMLIVTFTNAAAAEMRMRIEKRLDEECRKDPYNTGILRQKQLLGSAKICTIDSFCIDLVRENFEKAGVTPDFKMSDGYSLKPIDEFVLSGIINEYLESGNKAFLSLLDIVGAERDESNFLTFVLDIYYYSRQMAEPDEWFSKLAEAYAKKFDRNCVWYDYAFSKSQKIIDGMKNFISGIVDFLSGDEKASDAFLPSYILAGEIVNTLDDSYKKADWDEFLKLLYETYLPSLPTLRGFSGNESAAAAKAVWGYINSDIEAMKKLFYADCSTITDELAMLKEPTAKLSEILIKFEKELFDEYLRRNTFTFHNTEHLALQLLNNSGDEFLDRYDEVMVDEYQDTNDLQDRLFYVLSGKKSRLFVVGDVKQSIYGFRGANPGNFLAKKNRYIPLEKAAEGDPKKIILGKNFRCRGEVCDFINFFFTNMMTKETGSIVYDGEEQLITGADYPAAKLSPVELDIINNPGNNEEGLIAEAAHIAAFIKKTMEQGGCIKVNKDLMRNATYSDFTILLRSAKKAAAIMAAELRRQGIPVNYSVEGYAETTEISTFLSLLKVIDNPDSDIELLSVMMSPVFGFSAEQMAEIRIAKRDGSFYSAVTSLAGEGDEQCGLILEKLQKYRLLAATLTLPSLVTALFDETGYIDTVSAMNDGSRRRNNLLLLTNYAERYYTENNGTAGGFVNYIIKQSESGMTSAASTAGNDTVKIMSIHASKGLQFPVCIVAGCAAEFNDNDSRSNSLYSSAYGIGFRYFDEEKKTKQTTPAREVIIDSGRERATEEELRLLYVAMTRTQDKLLFTSSVKNTEKLMTDCKRLLQACGGINAAVLRRSKSYLKWLVLTAFLHPDGKELRADSGIIAQSTDSHIEISVVDAEMEQEETVTVTENPQTDDSIIEAINENMSYEYPFEKLTAVESKSSVSAIANKAESAKYAFSGKPAFMSGGGITAAERGTAMHRIIEFFDFSKSDDIEGEIDRLYEWQYISEREVKAVSREALKEFFQSTLFTRIKKSPLVKREMRFLTELPAREIDSSLDKRFEDEKIIVQGAVDLCFSEDGGITVLDFKTDRVENAEQLKSAYAEQLEIYARACEKIFETRVKRKIIYSFALSQEIEI